MRGLIAILVMSFAGIAMGEHYHVFILAGQSNMDGRGTKSELIGELAKFAKPQADVRIAYSNSTMRGPYETDGFVALAPGFSVAPGTREKFGADYKLPGETFGPEVSFGRSVADAMTDKHIAIIKFSEGGTSLHKDWNPDTRGALYDQMLAFVTKSLKSLKDAGDTYELSAFVWHQGESDSGLPEGEYQKLLTNLIDRVRNDLKEPKLLVVIGEVFDNEHRDRVRAAQRATTQAVARTIFVSADGLETFDNGTHFDTKSQIELGNRLADGFLKAAGR
jgi:hypothetical protein